MAAFCGSQLLGSIALLLSPLVALGHLLGGMFNGFLLPLKLAWGSAAQASAGNSAGCLRKQASSHARRDLSRLRSSPCRRPC